MSEQNPEPKPEPKTEVKTVEYDKFQRVVSAKQGLERQVEELKAETATLAERAATADTLAAQVSEWKAKAEDADTKFGRWQDIATRIGTTEADAIEAVEWQYGRLAEKDRPSLGDWLDGIKAEPEKAPTILRPLLAGGSVTRTAPKDTGGKAAPPAAGSQYSAEEIRAISSEAVRTGDWSKYREIRKSWT